MKTIKLTRPMGEWRRMVRVAWAHHSARLERTSRLMARRGWYTDGF